MLKDNVINSYFEWMLDITRNKKHSNNTSYRKLLTLLHSTEFTYSIDNDANRAADGLDLRWRFVFDGGGDKDILNLKEPCSVLEMLIALSYKFENIMDGPDSGNEIEAWFWTMIVNLGLDSMTDNRFDKRYVQDRISIFLDRKYKRNGEGGIIVIDNCKDDLRDVEIWNQMCWYLDSIL